MASERVQEAQAQRVVGGDPRLGEEAGTEPETAATEPTVHAQPQTAEHAPSVLADRYVLLRQIGSGGMGTVFAGYDRDLDRTVAIKLLDPRAAQKDESRARMLREAQAMARVRSPHVLTVHDVGTERGQIYIAMELMSGRTLRKWLRERPRSWREIVRVFEAAGRGLAAAHECGLIHRDFKPDNVLIDDDDKICVCDFGVAAAIADAPQPTRPALDSGPSSLDQELTAAGVVVGTPAYMSPEQLAGEAIDARSDQFSFCVALYEALVGRRPFVAESAVLLAEEMRTNPPRGVGRAPKWLRAIVLRGLALDPGGRFESMDALLRQLVRGRTRMRRRLIAGIAAAIAVVAIVAAVAVDRTLALAEPCALAPPPPVDLTGLANRFVALRTDGSVAAARVGKRIAAWQDEVAQVRHTACLAAHDGRESPQLFDLRMECVARTTREVAALATAFAKPTAELVDNAVLAVDRATDLQRCRGGRAQLEGLAVASPAATQLRERLATAEADDASGRYDAATTAALAIAAEAARLAIPAVEAEALLLAGDAREQAGDLVAAGEHWQRALVAIEASPDTHMRAIIYLDLARATNYLDRRTDSVRWTHQARALVERTDDNSLRWRVTEHEAQIAFDEDREAEAVALYHRALSEHQQLTGGVETIEDGELYTVLGDAIGTGPTTPETERILRHAVALFEREVGPHHPLLIVPLVALADVVENQTEALALARRSYDIARATAGPGTKIADAARGLATVLERGGRSAEARAVLDQAIADYPAPDTSSYAGLLSWRGSTRRGEGKLADALADAQRAVAIMRRVAGDDSLMLVAFQLDMAETLRALQHYDDARATVADTMRILSARGPDRPEVYTAELIRAMIELDAHRFDEALEHAERALVRSAKAAADDRATAQMVVARVLVALHRDRDRALALLAEARAVFERIEDRHRLAEIDRVRTMLGVR